MLTENRKRQRAEGDDEDARMPQAKRLSSALQSSETGRESWESESSSSESSWISSPDHAAGSSSSSHCGVDVIGPHGGPGPGPCSPRSASKQSDPTDLLSYQHINRVLREAHFHSLQSRAQSKHR
ncbi:protein FAM104A-like [Sinocyclocheilus rhinocerous]|uniref:protein FAM104A-like n=1 Tax=Sinocyclocheilus rhinocerous TaxID=307959 RepID=UPI0007B8D940|nr:PREDICTED: protein FAM104A-like [Sinocyclocheilus rhinocerous]XP_016371024.1 PREDICTED: protein FAM104A-like [Sinocyclocheilus rhinocerous]XP_016371025.1 PREDICTED: protein FAM104A-like [Sinocyclocheilus rhinocerous]